MPVAPRLATLRTRQIVATIRPRRTMTTPARGSPQELRDGVENRLAAGGQEECEIAEQDVDRDEPVAPLHDHFSRVLDEREHGDASDRAEERRRNQGHVPLPQDPSPVDGMPAQNQPLVRQEDERQHRGDFLGAECGDPADDAASHQTRVPPSIQRRTLRKPSRKNVVHNTSERPET